LKMHLVIHCNAAWHEDWIQTCTCCIIQLCCIKS
jgi:hypothetical protein